jgi:hypothetical protein
MLAADLKGFTSIDTCCSLVDSLLLFDPGADVFWLVPKMAAYAVALRAYAFVPPLVEGRYRDATEVCRDILGSPEPILSGIGRSY